MLLCELDKAYCQCQVQHSTTCKLPPCCCNLWLEKPSDSSRRFSHTIVSRLTTLFSYWAVQCAVPTFLALLYFMLWNWDWEIDVLGHQEQNSITLLAWRMYEMEVFHFYDD